MKQWLSHIIFRHVHRIPCCLDYLPWSYMETSSRFWVSVACAVACFTAVWSLFASFFITEQFVTFSCLFAGTVSSDTPCWSRIWTYGNTFHYHGPRHFYSLGCCSNFFWFHISATRVHPSSNSWDGCHMSSKIWDGEDCSFCPFISPTD